MFCSSSVCGLPDRHRAHVERGGSPSERAERPVDVLRRAVQGLDQNLVPGPVEADDPRDELVDELVRELTHEVALPVVAPLAVRRVEDALLVEEALRAHGVLDEPRCGAELGQLGRVGPRARVARRDDERRGERLVEHEHRLAGEVARCSGDDVAKAAKDIPHAVASVAEQVPDHALERVEAELEAWSRRRSCHRRLAAPTGAPRSRPRSHGGRLPRA